jgi:hypothetical protein
MVHAVRDSSQRGRNGGDLFVREGAHIESDQVVFDPAEDTRFIQSQAARQVGRA